MMNQTALEFITAYDCRNCGSTGYVAGERICPDCVAAQKTYQAMRKAEQVAANSPQDGACEAKGRRMVLASTKDYWKHVNQARLVCVSRWQNRVEILRFWTYRAYNPTPSSWARIERYQAGVK